MSISLTYIYNVCMYTVAQCAFPKLFHLCPVHLLASTTEHSGATGKEMGTVWVSTHLG